MKHCGVFCLDSQCCISTTDLVSVLPESFLSKGLDLPYYYSFSWGKGCFALGQVSVHIVLFNCLVIISLLQKCHQRTLILQHGDIILMDMTAKGLSMPQMSRPTENLEVCSFSYLGDKIHSLKHNPKSCYVLLFSWK